VEQCYHSPNNTTGRRIGLIICCRRVQANPREVPLPPRQTEAAGEIIHIGPFLFRRNFPVGVINDLQRKVVVTPFLLTNINELRKISRATHPRYPPHNQHR
jgi:hypothetical protein